jgi:vacuolar-type H+-ATPase subunit E/Vma4
VGVEELRSSLEQEGRARIAAIGREAAAEAERLRADAAQAASRRREELLGRAELELRREARARVAEARREARRLALAARAELLERVFERAAEELARALAAPSARAWLEARADEALALLPGGASRVTASSELAAGLAQALEGREGVRVEADPAQPAGFRASSADGAIVVDATVPSLIEQARTRLAAEVLRDIAPGGSSGREAQP